MFAGDEEGVGEGRRGGNRFRGRETSRGSRQYRQIFYQLIHAFSTFPFFSVLFALGDFFARYHPDNDSFCAYGNIQGNGMYSYTCDFLVEISFKRDELFLAA